MILTGSATVRSRFRRRKYLWFSKFTKRDAEKQRFDYSRSSQKERKHEVMWRGFCFRNAFLLDEVNTPSTTHSDFRGNTLHRWMVNPSSDWQVGRAQLWQCQYLFNQRAALCVTSACIDVSTLRYSKRTRIPEISNKAVMTDRSLLSWDTGENSYQRPTDSSRQH